VRSRTLFFALATALATPQAYAQTVPDAVEPGAGAAAEVQPSAQGEWALYPHERHIMVRAEATVGARMNDPYAAGALAPISPLLEGSYQFLHVGRFLMGPTLGFQAGFDATGAQFAIQPGWQVFRRLGSRVALTGRAAIPVLITRGACTADRVRADQGFPGFGFSLNRTTLPVPSAGYCPTASVGVELAAGAAFYVTSGVAVTAEAIFDTYFGDSGIVFPILGGGLGVMVDYEVLP
jgi:hypothetical protein